MEEYRRLAYAPLGDAFVDSEGELLPINEWPVGHAHTALEFLRLKRQALKDLLEYFRHAGIYGQPAPPPNNVSVNNMTIVPIERLTNEELDFYLALAEKGRAVPIDVTARTDKAAKTTP